MDSSYGIPSTYRSSNEYNGGTGLEPQCRSEDDFLAVVGLYCTFCRGVQENGFLHWHGGRARKLYGSGGFSNAIQISDTGVTKIPRVFPGSDGFDGKIFYRDLITELRICLWEPIRNHENIVSLIEVQWFPGPHPSIPKNWNYMWPTLEFETADGTLTEMLRHGPEITFMDKMNLLFDIAKALDCLHQCGVVHSDIKPDNILIFPNEKRKYIAKITDFGCSTILKLGETHGFLSGGTMTWSAPEVGERLSHEELCKTDLYSFGLVVWFIITGGHAPFKWLESWCDGAALSVGDILSLKVDDCFLPLSQESISELPLSEFQMRFVTDLLGATLCPKETRVKFLTPLFERYSYIFDREGGGGLPEPGFLGPIAPVNIRHLIHRVNMDDRLRGQILSSIKSVALSGNNVSDALTLGSLSWQIFLCYYHGFGIARDNKAAMSALIQACEFGHTEAQALVVQFHQAHGAEYPKNLPIVDWLAGSVSKGNTGASKALKSIDPEAYQRTIKEVRSTIILCEGCVVPGIDHDLCDSPQSAAGALEIIEPLFVDYNPESETLIREVDRGLREAGGSSIIHFAAAAGMESVVRGLIDNNICKLQVKTATGMTPLCLASRGGHRDTVLLLLSRMPPATDIFLGLRHLPIFESFCLHDLSSFDPDDALEVATRIAEKIQGAATTPRPLPDRSPCDPIMSAIFEESLESTKVLLQLGGRRAVVHLFIAASLLSGDILNLLMWDCADKGERPSTSDLDELYFYASAQYDPLDLIQRHGFEYSYMVIRTFETLDYFTRLWYPDLVFKFQKKAFDTLVRYRRYDIIQLVFDQFPKGCLSPECATVYPPLWWAMRLGDMETFSLFLENGAATYGDIETVFSKSVKISNPFYTGELIRYGCLQDDETLIRAGDIHMDTSSMQCFPSPFELAILYDCFDTAVYLYRATGRGLVNNFNGFLNHLIREGQHNGLSKLDFLLDFIEEEGIQLPTPIFGQNILHSLQDFWCVEPEGRRGEIRRYMINVVRRLSRFVNDRDMIHRGTPIFGAAIHHNILLVEALIDSGADLNIRNGLGLTVLDVILMHRLWEVVRTSPGGLNVEPQGFGQKQKDFCPKGWADHNEKRGLGCTPDSCLVSIYKGDTYDKRLDKIFSMIKAAGGSSVFQNCIEDLDTWTRFWEWRSRGELSDGKAAGGDEFELLYHFARIWGPRWHFGCKGVSIDESAELCEGEMYQKMREVVYGAEQGGIWKPAPGDGGLGAVQLDEEPLD